MLLEAQEEMASFTVHVKYKGGKRDSLEKAITLLNTYLGSIKDKQKTFDSFSALLAEDGTTPALGDTDVIVYMLRNLSKSLISKKGGSVAMAEANDKILGMTDLNNKICEVYADRLFQDSSKELAGAIYHEVAHIKSNQDNAMHKDKNGFLKESPDYNGSPTDENATFMGKHIARKVSMDASY
jgi:hypothetical protein